METEKTEGDVTTETNEAEGGENSQADVVSIPKSEWDKTNQTIGSLKRQIKDLAKSKETQETAQQTKPDESKLLDKLERMALRQAGIDHPDDIELARNTAKKWNMDIDEVLADEDFKVKLGRQQTNRSNVNATSNVKGSAGQSSAKESPEYWIAKGKPPSPTDIPNRKIRAKIARAMMANVKNGKTFYND